MSQEIAEVSEFIRLRIHVGTVIRALPFPEARNPSIKMEIDFGSQGIRWTSAQVTHHYSLQELPGKQVVAVLNFPVKSIAGFKSECLVLGAVEADGGVVLLTPDRQVENGLRIA